MQPWRLHGLATLYQREAVKIGRRHVESSFGNVQGVGTVYYATQKENASYLRIDPMREASGA